MIKFLHRKKYAYPILAVAVLSILVLVLLPSVPQIQSSIQKYSKKHPAIAKVLPAPLKPPNLSVPTTGDWLVIPKSLLKMPINEGSSIAVLDNHIGVWHQTGTINHNYVLAGHKLQYFRSVNQSLYNLDLLKPGDEQVYVVINGVDHEYKVLTTSIVLPTDIAILNPTKKPLLTIYTCNDFFNHSRFVVTAVPIVTYPKS